MITIHVYKQANYAVPVKRIKDCITQVLKENGLVSDFGVSVGLVSETKMKELANAYYGDNEDHPVFTFPESELKEAFVVPDGMENYLGEIVISYQYCVNESNKSGKLVSEIVCDMAAHGALHLLGIHH